MLASSISATDTFSVRKWSGQFYVQDGYIFGPKHSGEYYIKDNYIHGPTRSGEFYISDGHIFGPDNDLPWLED
ncbi:hypothetical protein QF002_000937 [Paraburkholderia youngii]